MRRLLLFLLLAGCSKGPQADLQYISEARSAAAEWALINQQAADSKLTDIYVASMRQSLRDQITSARSSLTKPDSRYARAIDSLIAEPGDAPPEELRAYSEELKQIEDGLESA
jgi:hypothetical protein